MSLWTRKGWLERPPTVEVLGRIWSSLSIADQEDFVYFAARGGHEQLLRFAIKSGVRVSAPCSYAAESTPLHGACWGRHRSCIRMLVMAGADLSSKNSHGELPKDNAAARSCFLDLKAAVQAFQDHSRKAFLDPAGVDWHPSLCLLLLAHRHGCIPTFSRAAAASTPPEASNWSCLPIELVRVILSRAFARPATPPLLTCSRCHWRVCGIRCCGRRSPAMEVQWDGDGYHGYRQVGPSYDAKNKGEICGELLLVDKGKGAGSAETVASGVTLKCPKGCGKVTWRCCVDIVASAREDETSGGGLFAKPIGADALAAIADAHAAQEARGHGSDDSPMLSCTICGYSVDGILCAGTAKAPTCELTERKKSFRALHPPEHLQLLPRNGFFERVWCAFVWSCRDGCGRAGKGGLYHASHDGKPIGCASGEECTGEMKAFDYNERNGFPIN